MKRLIPAVLVALATFACGSDSPSPNPGGPSPVTTTSSVTTTSIPTIVSLAGTVSPSVGGARIAGAIVSVGDGPNAGKTTTTDGGGNYRFEGLTPGNANLSARAPGYEDQGRGVFIDGANRLDFALRPRLWTRAGSGDTVFDMPTYINRVHIHGHWNGNNTSNFAVQIAGRLVVNVTLRDMPNHDFDGTYVTSGGVVQITISSQIAWSFAEVR